MWSGGWLTLEFNHSYEQDKEGSKTSKNQFFKNVIVTISFFSHLYHHSIYFWREDFHTSKEQAIALKNMIDKGATDSSKLFDELQQMYQQNG